MKQKRTIQAIISAGLISAATGCVANNTEYSFPEPRPTSAASTGTHSYAASDAAQPNYITGNGDAISISGISGTSAARDAEAPVAATAAIIQATPRAESPANSTKEKHRLDFLFAYNSATQFMDANGKPLTRDAVKAQLTEYISKVGNDLVYVDGFASVEGNDKPNLKLSNERAKTIESLFCDVNFTGTFEVRGLGETEIFGDKLTADELNGVEKLTSAQRVNHPKLQKNRRVVLTNTLRNNEYTAADAVKYAGSCKDASAKLKPAHQTKPEVTASSEIIRKFPESNTAPTVAYMPNLIETPSLLEHYDAAAVKSEKEVAIDTMIAGAQRTLNFYNQHLPKVDAKLADLEARCRPGMPDMERPVKDHVVGKDNKVHTIYGSSKCQEGYSNLTADLEGSLANLGYTATELKNAYQAVSELPAAESRNYSSQIEELATKASKVSASYKEKETKAKSASRMTGSDMHGSMQRKNIYENMRRTQAEFMYSQGISYEEIGKALNLSSATVESYIAQPKAA
ncbi:hypothetical protein HZB03_01310 [Candidatus Woesearchaeota archaeon]|nr:hypothetical protein [Candidatus Woesearchaeota archaeon]